MYMLALSPFIHVSSEILSLYSKSPPITQFPFSRYAQKIVLDSQHLKYSLEFQNRLIGLKLMLALFMSKKVLG